VGKVKKQWHLKDAIQMWSSVDSTFHRINGFLPKISGLLSLSLHDAANVQHIFEKRTVL
jgi:hypothetical protein